MKRSPVHAIDRGPTWVTFVLAGTLGFAASALADEAAPREVSVLKRASYQAPAHASPATPPPAAADPAPAPTSAFGDMTLSPMGGEYAPAPSHAGDQGLIWGFESENNTAPPAEEGWLRPLQRGHPDDAGRHIGRGFPLLGTSWLNRPYHGGWLVGTLIGDSLIDGQVDQGTGLLGGYRVGWDFDHYWGTEGRIAFAHLELTDLAEELYDRTGRNYYIDGHLLYYPWGDARLRPYVSVGLGAADFEFLDSQGTVVDETLFHLPWGLGCKYLWKNWLALRVSFEDNFAIGRGAVDTMHNWSLTGGAEVRIGRRPRRYFAYD